LPSVTFSVTADPTITPVAKTFRIGIPASSGIHGSDVPPSPAAFAPGTSMLSPKT
jgi:hypothetical protein